MFEELTIALGGLVATILAILGWRREASKRREAEARAKVAERLSETIQEQGERREKVAQMSDDDLIDYLRRDRR